MGQSHFFVQSFLLFLAKAEEVDQGVNHICPGLMSAKHVNGDSDPWADSSWQVGGKKVSHWLLIVEAGFVLELSTEVDEVMSIQLPERWWKMVRLEFEASRRWRRNQVGGADEHADLC